GRAQRLTLSAPSPEGLRALAQRWHDFAAAAGETLPLADVCAERNTRRAHLEHRMAVVATSPAELTEQLAAFAQGEERGGVAVGQALGERRKVVFVFPGQGSQWIGMGRELLRDEPVFADSLRR